MGFEVARELLRLGESPVYPLGWFHVPGSQAEMRSTGSLVNHLKHIRILKVNSQSH